MLNSILYLGGDAMNNYVITSTGSFLSAEELYHYGIPGMKWGVRKKIEDAYTGMRRRVMSSKVYDRVTNSKAGRKVKSEYTDIRNASKRSAKSQLQRYNGNTKKAMAATAAKSFGSAAAVNIGGRVVSQLLFAGAVAGGAKHVGLAAAGASAANAVRKGTRAASVVIAAYGAMRVSDVYKQGKRSK